MDEGDIAAELLARGIVALITTRSVDVTVHTAEGHITVPVPPVDVVDTVGAGDAFTAAVVTGLLRGIGPSDALRHAARVAAFVCSQSGATPLLPHDLLSAA